MDPKAVARLEMIRTIKGWWCVGLITLEQQKTMLDALGATA